MNIKLNPLTWDNQEIFDRLLQAEPDLFCGDIWVSIDHPKFEHGLFCQVELLELENGTYSENEYEVFCYKNVVVDDYFITSDFDKTMYKFKFEIIGENDE